MKNQGTKFSGLGSREIHEIVFEKNVEKNKKRVLTSEKPYDILSERSREGKQNFKENKKL